MTKSSKEKILKRIKNKTREEHTSSLSGFHFLKHYNQPLLQLFTEKLVAVNGTFIYSESIPVFQDQFKLLCSERNWNQVYCIEQPICKLIPVMISSQLLKSTPVAITGCEYLIAQTGSAIVSTAHTLSRRSFAFPEVHIIVAFKNQLIAHLEDGLNLLMEKYSNDLPSQITTITGPSRTADIEKTLVLGAHGPKELIIFYIEE